MSPKKRPAKNLPKNKNFWRSRTAFLFAAIGFAVGLGNVWRFPYLAHKFGGGAFLVPYFIALFTLGLPLLIMEFGLGQRASKGMIGAFGDIKKKFSALGFLGQTAGILVLSYYVVIMAWIVLFLIYSFQSPLPWAENPAAFFYNDLLQASNLIQSETLLNMPILYALILCWLSIFFCVRYGVRSVEKVIMISMPLPIILLTLLGFRGLFLEGAFEGLRYYMSPNLSLLFEADIWLAAASQIFFSIGIGLGVMISFASYNKETQGLVGSAAITAISNSGVSLLAGVVVFTILGHMSLKTGMPIEHVIQSGPGLVFVVLPQAMTLLPGVGQMGANIFSIFFFLSLFALAIDSAFSIVEALLTTLKDKFGYHREQSFAGVVCLVGFLISLIYATSSGLRFLEFIDQYVIFYLMVIIGLLQCIAVGWFSDIHGLKDYINSVSRNKIGNRWIFAIRFLIPAVLIVLLTVNLL